MSGKAKSAGEFTVAVTLQEQLVLDYPVEKRVEVMGYLHEQSWYILRDGPKHTGGGNYERGVYRLTATREDTSRTCDDTKEEVGHRLSGL